MAILPGAQIGILGGGQLGRMTAMAAQSLGYGVRVLDPDPHCAAGAVADEVIVSAFDDPVGAETLARKSAVVTYEIEQIGQAALAAAQRHAPVRPSPAVLAIVQDRLEQKNWLSQHGFPVGPYRPAVSVAEVEASAQVLGALRLKARRGGYDGRSQAGVREVSEATASFQSLGAGPVVCEQELVLRRELSVMVARTEQGEMRVFPAAQNWHQDGILSLSVLPGALEPALTRRAEELGRAIAAAMEVCGLLAIEFFDTEAHGLLVNELSPRPHNTFHATETACLTSQFEQLVRAVCGLPLGLTDILRPTALANLLGDLWVGRDHPPRFDRALALPGVYLGSTGSNRGAAARWAICLRWRTRRMEALKLVRQARDSL